MKQQNTLNVLKNVGAFIASAIPILQLGYKWFPKQVNELFVSEKYIFFTTTITFLLSIFLILLSINVRTIQVKTIRKVVPNKEFGGKRRMTQFISLLTLANFCIPLVFVFAILFMYLSNFENQNSAILQSAAYILTFSVSTFIVTNFTVRIAERKNYEEIKKERPRLAINLAKESDGFGIYPRINFLSATENIDTRQYIVEVNIKDQKYRIITDSTAETLHGVYPVTNDI